jgi:tetratricopeptide (TPR) repeat protein
MKFVSTIATAAALVAMGAAAQPGAAQKPAAAPAAAPAAPARKFNITPTARKPLTDLQKAVNAKDETAYPAALAAAQAAVTTTDEKYILAKLVLQHSEQVNDTTGRLAAYQAVLASGGADASETALINHNISILAANTNNWALAESTLTPMVAADPNDVDNMINLARVKIELKREGEALPLLLRAIQLTEAAGKPAPEGWYRNALGIAYQTHNQSVVAQMNAALVKNYPSSQNLSNAILIYNSGTELPKDVQLDLYRLMYVSGGMNQSGEYLQLASMLDVGGLPGEEKSVLEAGLRSGKLSGGAVQQVLQRTTSRIADDRASLPAAEQKARAAANGTLALSTASDYAGYGDYAKAIDLYHVALQKGGVDPNVVNTRLGIALALAGRRPEAEAAFRAVGGSRTQLAGLWLTWLAQRG